MNSAPEKVSCSSWCSSSKDFIHWKLWSPFTTEHTSSHLHRHPEAFSLAFFFLFVCFSPSPTAPSSQTTGSGGQSWPYLRCAWPPRRRAWGGGREQPLAPWQRSVPEPAWGQSQGRRSPRCRRAQHLPPSAPAPPAAPEAGPAALAAGTGQVPPYRPPPPPSEGTASAATAASALTSGESDPGGQRRPPAPRGTGG